MKEAEASKGRGYGEAHKMSNPNPILGADESENSEVNANYGGEDASSEEEYASSENASDDGSGHDYVIKSQDFEEGYIEGYDNGIYDRGYDEGYDEAYHDDGNGHYYAQEDKYEDRDNDYYGAVDEFDDGG